VGKKKQPTYRLIVNESSRDTYGHALEIVGHYDPFTKVTEVNKDRILYWISKGAQLSPTIHNLLVDQNVIKAEKIKASKGKKKTEPEVLAEKKTATAPVVTPEEKPAEAPAAEAPQAEVVPPAPAEVIPAPAAEEKPAEAPMATPAA